MNLYFAAFLILPIAALVAKGLDKLKMSVWAIFFIYLVVGWLLVHLAVQSSLRDFDEIIRNTPNPSEELLNEWQNDGATQTFALLFGWLYAVVFFLLCLPLLHATRLLKEDKEAILIADKVISLQP